MKTTKVQRKELTATIIAKIGEALEGVNDKAFKKVKRSVENSAKKLSKKFTATLQEISKKEKAVGKKNKNKNDKAAVSGKLGKAQKQKEAKSDEKK